MKKISMKWLIVFMSCLILVSCVGCAEIRKVYWDKKIMELCKLKGDITIYEKIELRSDEYNNLPRYGGRVSLPIMELAKENQNYYSTAKYFVLREDNPYVYRADISITRKLDQKVMAKYSTYNRIGGDAKIGFHPSHFSCPDPETIANNIDLLFTIEGN